MDNKENRKKKRTRKSTEQFNAAVVEVLEKGASVRSVAAAYGIGKSYLARLVKNAKSLPQPSNFDHKPNIGNRRVFSTNEEVALASYLKTASKMAYGLTTTQTRSLAFEYARKLNKQLPPKWDTKKIAGKDWLRGFMSRHHDLSLRQPEQTSLARATSFNPANVKAFFTNLEKVMTKFKFSPDRIFNADETGLSTVMDAPKVITQRGIKQVAQASSAERGQLVTMLAFICATGNSVPPVFIFPRVRFKDFMLEDCPVGSKGLCHKSGWMTSENFALAFEHFIDHVKPCKERPVLLTIDNHDTHINLHVITRAREVGVVIITFPPHCSHKLQPLDVAVFGPFKTYLKMAQNNWMVSNPGKTINIYHLPKFARIAYENAFTIKNIRSGFQKTGISPFNNNIFSEDEFLTSYVSDRPVSENFNTEVSNTLITESVATPSTSQDNDILSMPSTSGLSLTSPSRLLTTSSSATNDAFITPEAIQPFPKAMPRKSSIRGRKKGSSRILTDSPEKDTLEKEYMEKQVKEKKKLQMTEKKQSVKRKVFEESSDSEISINYNDSDTNDFEEAEENIVEEDINGFYKKGNYVLVKFETKKTRKYAAGEILDVLSDNEYTVKFLKKKFDSFHFIYPEIDDVADINKNDIEMKLPEPHLNDGTDRRKSFYSFDINFTGICFC